MYSSYSFSTSALDGSEWSASRPGSALTPGKGPSRYPLYRRLGGPQSRSGPEARGKILCLCRGSNSDRPVVQPVARHYTDWASWLRLPVLLIRGSSVRLPKLQAVWTLIRHCNVRKMVTSMQSWRRERSLHCSASFACPSGEIQPLFIVRIGALISI
jgi:hypothetical protein